MREVGIKYADENDAAKGGLDTQMLTLYWLIKRKGGVREMLTLADNGGRGGQEPPFFGKCWKCYNTSNPDFFSQTKIKIFFTLKSPENKVKILQTFYLGAKKNSENKIMILRNFRFFFHQYSWTIFTMSPSYCTRHKSNGSIKAQISFME